MCAQFEILTKEAGQVYSQIIMNKPNFSVLLFAVVFSLLTASSCVMGENLTSSEIESVLMGHEEPGYSFSEKLADGAWIVEYMRPDWKLSWELVVTTTDPDPEKSLLVIGTTLAQTETLNGNLLLQMLNENSFDSNPGSYSIFIEDGIYYVQYAIKLPQTMVDEKVLVEGLGFVGGYANSRYGAIAKYLVPASPVAEEGTE